jgi:hypothetical protein
MKLTVFISLVNGAISVASAMMSFIKKLKRKKEQKGKGSK